ncbi:hypothetical protein PF005_g20162 [Phytophthora fragariae]|uniref:RxLR effector protein n=1 Tax=Phytophthora fragariae TaxID=53985 RepID=A0A6A3SHN7_9STRA|nr:hypothetical protein PF009_g20386 [Phytophthora fragariae]KAE9019220.1 hypothetical protein PF011_g5922 [Phytophthora fragariae]KAE9071114.1 hypothetical protein PF010_g26001 [Phytophthora fragariae]KAE9087806.1 hypothetical protein PF007_g20236 [Phytophthora fragariae]KAE9117293.1 hypothetical protein PF006_g18847 [Phytophthora fragariae]
MRLSNTLVVFCAAVLLASGHSLSETTEADQAIVSKLAPLELGASINALAGENKRSLRSHDDDDDEEERYKEWKISGLKTKLAKLEQLTPAERSAIVRNYQDTYTM